MRLIATIGASALALASVMPVLADTDLTVDDLEMIDAILIDMQCGVTEDNIAKAEYGGFALYDVVCADGRYDIELDENYGLVAMWKR